MNRFLTHGRSLLIVLVTGLFIGGHGNVVAQNRQRPAKSTADLATFQKEYATRRKDFCRSLEALAKVCEEEKDLPDAAAVIRELTEPIETSELRYVPLPRHVSVPLNPNLPADERFWRSKLKSLRQDFARDLFALSRRALTAKHVNFSLDLVREVLLHDGDHIVARKILGFVRNSDEWVSAFEAQMRKEKKVWTDKFGWIREDYIENYEQGQRLIKGRWISREKANDLHADFSSPWTIETEHYQILTNHSLEKGAELAGKLEKFHVMFFQMLGGFFNNGAEVQALFDGKNANPRNRKGQKNVVKFYRTREEYLATLRKLTNQNVEITRGMYFPDTRIAHFFFDPEGGDDGTIYHEGTHQLLTGSRPMTSEIGVKSDFWIIEGIACYMESFHREGDRFVVGDPSHGRIQAARAHFFNDRYYVPFRDFTRMGMNAFQSIKQPEIGRNYSQGAALTHFFMHFDDGKYREALIEYLSQIYSPEQRIRERPDSLSDLIGLPDGEIDEQYAEYIRTLKPTTQARKNEQ